MPGDGHAGTAVVPEGDPSDCQSAFGAQTFPWLPEKYSFEPTETMEPPGNPFEVPRTISGTPPALVTRHKAADEVLPDEYEEGGAWKYKVCPMPARFPSVGIIGPPKPDELEITEWLQIEEGGIPDVGEYFHKLSYCELEDPKLMLDSVLIPVK